ncbi:MAG: glnD [Hydrocarboniphaga sp.]|uniref:[protein-PII] uridylyltransferase n=1 Tax=Hydrocarboniphaga sp. TaxID=2033016 RepID=UPI00261BCD20|nr:[protein-PII] uridylyltransferase [Hydrocarboniphaga sp.]MDB5968955.1 glnD [Hydrocarboniphaga sp.]
MGVELDLAEDEAAAVFSARKIRTRLRADGVKPVSAFRETLSWGRDRLYSLFDDGAPADSLVHARAHIVDEVLREAWLRVLPEAPAGVTLVAVGGYGRGELLPHSDIDILLLHVPGALEQYRGALERFTAFLWDIGLEVGQSVRSVDECVDEAGKDITVITNLIESRLLIGDASLYSQMQDALTPDKVWPVADFFRAKRDEQAARYRKYDDTGYKLEPNVKESPGGLRDIHTVGWVAKRHFGAQTLHELRDRGFLTKTECDELFAGQDFLWRVRFALHMITGRREDRLLFDHQIKVAALFGYVDVDGQHHPNWAVEQFMQLYYRTIKSLSCLNDMLLQLFDDAIIHGDRQQAVHPLNSRFQIRGQYIEARDDELFRKQPASMIEIFLLLQQNPKIGGVSAQTVRLLLRDNRLINAEVRNDVRARGFFIEMFREGAGLTRNLRRMNRYGVLGRYLPAFGKVVGLMQYDLFHTLTVDEHLLYVLRNLRRMALPRFQHELPFCSELFKKLAKPELLYVAGFFHDMSKGSGGDHSELGAVEAARFCLEHGLSHADADLVAWLVQHHLMMSLTAQRADISDPQIVGEFARKVAHRDRLDYLFLMTVADIRATNPALWNSWRESLLTELYRTTARALERGLDNPLRSDDMAAEAKSHALELLTGSGIAAAKSQEVWARFEDDYFLRHSPEELAWHLPEIVNATPEALPLILVRPIDGRGTTVFVYTRDRDHLFGLSTGVLARLGLNILDARINTTADGYTLDSYVVMEGDGSPITQPHRFDEIRDSLHKVLADSAISIVDVNRRMPQRLKHFSTPTNISFSRDVVRNRTILEIVTADRPGLLSLIGRVFHKRAILLDAAKIGTIGERAEDVFFITDQARNPITDKMLEELREVLIRTLDHAIPH